MPHPHQIRVRHLAVTALAVYVACSAVVIAQAPIRVDARLALAQLLTQVEPVVPPEAARARTGGVVIADVTVSTTGRVTAVTILAGPGMLHAAAEAALRQWTFRPFVIDGAARPVMVVLDVNFPDPVRDEEIRVREVFRTALWACDRELELDAARAVDSCNAAVAAAAKLPRDVIHDDVVGQSEMALRSYLQALVGAARLVEAVDVIEQLISMRSAPGKADDRVNAGYYAMLALVQHRLGAPADAERAFSKATAVYEALFREAPAQTARGAAEQLLQALRQHAAFRRLRGDTAGADALDARAAALVLPEGPAERSTDTFTRLIRRAGDITIVESTEARIGDADLRRIQSILEPEDVWWVSVHQLFGGGRDPALSVDACIAPTVVRPTFRRGRCASLAKTAADVAPYGGWELFASGHEYVQVAREGGDASTEPPLAVRVLWDAAPLPTDEMLIDLVTAVRGRAVPAPTPRRLSDIQPWPIAEIVLVGEGDVRVTLVREDRRAAQYIALRSRGGDWEIVEIR